jgi:hypothetical protein
MSIEIAIMLIKYFRHLSLNMIYNTSEIGDSIKKLILFLSLSFGDIKLLGFVVDVVVVVVVFNW